MRILVARLLNALSMIYNKNNNEGYDMRRLSMLVVLILLSIPTIASASGESGTRCFQSPEGYGEGVILDRQESKDKAMSTYRGASSAAKHFGSCVAAVKGGISASFMKDECECMSAAKDVCDPKDPKGDCTLFF